ncbi:MAG: hypothetical protein PHH37_15460 [Paludibacter sp.]|nr:hypothetical protein [Paludibacter sp.]
MKKLLFLLTLPILMLSCTFYGDDTNIDTVNLSVKQNEWTENFDTNGLRYYYASFNMPEITSNVYYNGSIQVYLISGAEASQKVLPYVRHYEDVNGTRWTRTIDYDFVTGNLMIYVTNSDFVTDQPAAMNFRVVIMSQPN